MLTLAHGSHDHIVLHPGLCLADDDTAAVYARTAGGDEIVTTVTLDLASVTVRKLAGGYDTDSNTAPGDKGEDYGVDVIIFADADVNGREHTTYRLMTARALAAVSVVSARSLVPADDYSDPEYDDAE